MYVKVGIPDHIVTLQAILGSEGPKKGHKQAKSGSSAFLVVCMQLDNPLWVRFYSEPETRFSGKF